ncbi:hypothetical protein B0T14DRAFT_568715 [Immersiella caudata]|uniref:Uncharacterized protein n=1 Tax=Immersiella caudata TaxID=314043 RepID=A0AA39WKP2_9PEZI|nr:hypothetical protein B0T14DRAFT_568715 [Immersiella caudata]
MADIKSDGASWFSILSLLPAEYHWILNRISMFFAGLAFVIIAPIIGLIIYDLSLWFWRLLVGMVSGLQSPQQPQPVPVPTPSKDRAGEPEKIVSPRPENGLKPRGFAEKTRLK